MPMKYKKLNKKQWWVTSSVTSGQLLNLSESQFTCQLCFIRAKLKKKKSMFNDRGHSILLYRSTREYDVYRKIIIEEYLMTQGNVQEILREKYSSKICSW